MKKLFLLLVAAATMMFASCGGSKSSYQAPVTLDELDDYFTVKSYKLQTDVKEKGLDHLGDAKGTLVLVLKRNNEEMKLKPSHIDYAYLEGTTVTSDYYVFEADIEGVVRKLLKVEPGSEEKIEIPIKIQDPYKKYNSEEENQKNRQAHYDALIGASALEEISFDIKLIKEDDDDY